MNTPVRRKLRMYIVLRRDISSTAAFIAYGHATLGTYLTWQDDRLMQEWQRTSFVKIALSVADQRELDWAKALGEHRVFTESTLGNVETCLGFRVVEGPDPRFRTLRPWVMADPNAYDSRQVVLVNPALTASNFDVFLREEGILNEVSQVARERIVQWLLKQSGGRRSQSEELIPGE